MIMVIGLALGIAFIAFLIIVGRHAMDVQDYLDEVKALKDRDLFD